MRGDALTRVSACGEPVRTGLAHCGGQPAVLVPVTATVTQVSTTSFAVNLNAAVSGLTVILTGATVQSSTPSADNTS